MCPNNQTYTQGAFDDRFVDLLLQQQLTQESFFFGTQTNTRRTDNRLADHQ